MKFPTLSLALAFLAGASAQEYADLIGTVDGLCPVPDGEDCSILVAAPCTTDYEWGFNTRNTKKPYFYHKTARGIAVVGDGSWLTQQCGIREAGDEEGAMRAWAMEVGANVGIARKGSNLNNLKYGTSGRIYLTIGTESLCVGVEPVSKQLQMMDCVTSPPEQIYWALSFQPTAIEDDGPPLFEGGVAVAPGAPSSGGSSSMGGNETMEDKPMDEPMFDGPATIVDIVKDSANHTVLLEAVSAAGLADVLMSEGPFTLFAPTDEAFAMYANETAMYMGEEYQMHLADILSYHVAPAKLMAGDLRRGPLEMGNGETANVVVRPTVMIGDATVVAADLEAGNGVVHVIDDLLLPAWTGVDLVTAAAGIAEFSTLVEYLGQANLTGALEGGPFTVFAPTNEAFAAADATLEGLLAGDEANAVLAEILLYHVHQGIATSESIMDGDEIEMLTGDTTTFSLMEVVMNTTEADPAMVDNMTEVVVAATEPEYIPKLNDAVIVTYDNLVSNGIIHVIDTVLIPPSLLPPAED